MRSVWDEVWKKDVYSEKGLREIKARYKVSWLLQFITIKSKDKVLDIGCGGGYIAKELYDQTKAYIYAVDSSQQAVSLAINNCKGTPVKFKYADARKIPCKDNSMNCVLCVGVLEHIREIEDTLGEVRRVLKNDGYIYIVSSNRYSFMYVQRVLRQAIHLWPYGYQKNWKKEDLNALLKKYGFIAQRVEIQTGVGNFKFIDKLDKLFSTKRRKRGRYIYYIGRLAK